MRIVRGIDAVEIGDRGSHAAIGNFDGVHRGHQAVIGAAAEAAREKGGKLSVVTFEPHPRTFFGRGAKAFRLTPPPTKERRLSAVGVDVMFVFAFDANLASLPAETFAREVLGDALGLKTVAAGADFRFGHRRKGDLTLLQSIGKQAGYEMRSMEMAGDGPEAWSSSAVRTALRTGDPGEAARQLGYWHCIEGRVRRGEGRGRGLGMATANLSIGDICLPAFGIYAVVTSVLDGAYAGEYRGVASLGVNPTFEIDAPCLETHLLDFDGDLYDAEIAVGLCAYLRPEKKFESLDDLARSMRRDGEEARKIHDSLPAPWDEAIP